MLLEEFIINKHKVRKEEDKNDGNKKVDMTRPV